MFFSTTKDIPGDSRREANPSSKECNALICSTSLRADFFARGGQPVGAGAILIQAAYFD